MKAICFSCSAEKEFYNIFQSLCGRTSSWEVWADFIYITAVCLSNAADLDDSRKKYRANQCDKILGRYTDEEKEKFSKLSESLVNALEQDPEQDFLGTIFMKLQLNNHWKGQFFTPYNLCAAIAKMELSEIKRNLDERPWISINDPACGAGALLIAARNEAKKNEVSSHQVLFVGQDVDTIAALMCYIQLSLLGCAGYVVVSDSISNPIVGDTPLIPILQEGQDIWYTPVFFDLAWQLRIAIAALLQE